MFSLQLLGVISLEGPSGPVTGAPTQRRRLAVLALLGTASLVGCTRDKLIGLLWPNTSERQARHLLSNALYVLRRELGEDAVVVSGEMLRLNPEVVWTDVAAFEAAIRRGELKEAVELYRGPFIAGFDLGDSQELEHWVEAERARLAGLYAKALEALAQQAEDAGGNTSAVEWWQKAAAQQPYDSRIALRLMRAFVAAGNRGGALEHARVHELLMREEMGADPAPEVRAYSDELRQQPEPAAAFSTAATDIATRSVTDSAARTLTPPLLAAPTTGLREVIYEIHDRWLWQALLVYVGGALICYKLVEGVTSGFALPTWFPNLAVILFALGLVFVLAFASASLLPAAGREGKVGRSQTDATPVIQEVQQLRFLSWRNTGISFLVALTIWGIIAASWIAFGDVSSVAEKQRKSIAVLPFENLSPDPNDAFFTDGTHEEIIAQLAKAANLKVISRTSVMEYTDRPANLRKIAEELNVTHVLEGSVRRAGDRVRITTQLIAAEDDETLWAESYEEELSDIFAIQANIAHRVAAALKAHLSPEEERYIASQPTDNLEAYNYYLRGRQYSDRPANRAKRQIAEELYLKALELDPDFALAAASLADLYSWARYNVRDEPRELADKARAAAQRAVALDPDLAEAHLALGNYFARVLADYDRALQEFTIALKLNPNNSYAHGSIGKIHNRWGQFEEALANMQRAVELSPRDTWVLWSIGATLVWMRRYDDALPYLDRYIELAPDGGLFWLRVWAYLNQPDGVEKALQAYMAWERTHRAEGRGIVDVLRPFERAPLRILHDHFREGVREPIPKHVRDYSGWFLAKAISYDLDGETAQAAAYYDSARVSYEARIEEFQEGPLNPLNAMYPMGLALSYAGLGRAEDAIREAQRAVDLRPISQDGLWGHAYIAALAEVYVMVGDYDAAIDQLEILLSITCPISPPMLEADPIWDPIREHPRFRALLEKGKPISHRPIIRR